MPSEEAFRRAESAATTAVRIDDALAEAHASIGLITDHAHLDLRGAIEHFKRAIELSPNYAPAHAWYGVVLTRMGRFEQSEFELKRAQELDPTSLNIALNLAQHYLYSRQYDRAIEEAKKGIELDPNLSTEYLVLAIAYEQKGMYDQAVDAAKDNLVCKSPRINTAFKAGIPVLWDHRLLAKRNRDSTRLFAQPGWPGLYDRNSPSQVRQLRTRDQRPGDGIQETQLSIALCQSRPGVRRYAIRPQVYRLAAALGARIVDRPTGIAKAFLLPSSSVSTLSLRVIGASLPGYLAC